jgi:hypothetical protein
MVIKGRRWLVPAVAAVALLAVGWVLLRDTTSAAPPAGPAAPEAGRPSGKHEADLPRIDLARLDRPRPKSGVGQRDLFDFATPPPTPPPPLPSAPPVAVVETAPAVVESPTPPPLPPLNLKFIGSFEGRKGLKVAVLMTDHKEVLTAQAGEVVANRYRVVKIGLESVDLQEVGTERVRRIPLKGN